VVLPVCEGDRWQYSLKRNETYSINIDYYIPFAEEASNANTIQFELDSTSGGVIKPHTSTWGTQNGRQKCQFIDVNGKPIIVHCMQVYQSHPSVDDIYVVCLRGWEDIVKDYAVQFGISKLRGLISAGNSGAASLKNGYEFLKDKYASDDVVIIQEATRPMITTETISKVLLACSENGSATICHSMNDYVQFDLSGDYPEYLEREKIIALQSPESHRFSLVSEVFDMVQSSGHPLSESNCTMLLYNLGFDINFVEGGINNIKIEREEDIIKFSAWCK